MTTLLIIACAISDKIKAVKVPHKVVYPFASRGFFFRNLSRHALRTYFPPEKMADGLPNYDTNSADESGTKVKVICLGDSAVGKSK